MLIYPIISREITICVKYIQFILLFSERVSIKISRLWYFYLFANTIYKYNLYFDRDSAIERISFDITFAKSKQTFQFCKQKIDLANNFCLMIVLT